LAAVWLFSITDASGSETLFGLIIEFFRMILRARSKYMYTPKN